MATATHLPDGRESWIIMFKKVQPSQSSSAHAALNWPQNRLPQVVASTSYVLLLPSPQQALLNFILPQGVDSRQLWDKLCPTVGIGDTPRVNFNRNAAASAVLDFGATSSLSAISCTALFSHLLNGFAGEQQCKHQQTQSILFGWCRLQQSPAPSACTEVTVMAVVVC
jgi:hypothetical protein